MPGTFLKGLRPGTILRHARFYTDKASGVLKPKFLLVLAATRSGDVVIRLLTSQQHGRPEQPPCYHGLPYPSFYLGVIDPALGLGKKSWLDLRGLDDADGDGLGKAMNDGVVTVVMALDEATIRGALECAAAADDTTQAQAKAIRDQLAALR
jgi:hypothetical protein